MFYQIVINQKTYYLDIVWYIITRFPLINHVRLAAGNVLFTKQVMLNVSPTLYLGLNPKTWGLSFGFTERKVRNSINRKGRVIVDEM